MYIFWLFLPSIFAGPRFVETFAISHRNLATVIVNHSQYARNKLYSIEAGSTFLSILSEMVNSTELRRFVNNLNMDLSAVLPRIMLLFSLLCSTYSFLKEGDRTTTS